MYMHGMPPGMSWDNTSDDILARWRRRRMTPGTIHRENPDERRHALGDDACTPNMLLHAHGNSRSLAEPLGETHDIFDPLHETFSTVAFAQSPRNPLGEGDGERRHTARTQARSQSGQNDDAMVAEGQKNLRRQFRHQDNNEHAGDIGTQNATNTLSSQPQNKARREYR